MEDIPQYLTDSILPDYDIILVKVNYDAEEYEDGSLEPPDNLHAVISYLKDKKVEIVYAAAGIHLNGEHKKPHCHYHLVVKSLPTGEFRSNNSQNRKRWLAKAENSVFSFDNVTFSFPKKLEPVWQTLSYPFKEGLVCNRKYQIGFTDTQISFLTEYGKNLYQVSLGKKAKQDAYEERKKCSLIELLEFCKNNRSSFITFRDMVEFLEDEYLAKMTIEQKPTLSNYRENCYKVGNTLGIFRYCDKI